MRASTRSCGFVLLACVMALAEQHKHDPEHREHHEREPGSKPVATSTMTTSTATTTTFTRTTTTFTTSTTSTSTSTTGPHVFGGEITRKTFDGWLSVWRSKYKVGVWNAGLPDPWESMLPEALKGVEAKVVESKGGVAGGIVTEGMGYGLMIEGFLAAKGSKEALVNGLGLAKTWLAMVNGPGTVAQPFAGGRNETGSATELDKWPYGVSAVQWSHMKLGAAGVAAWKFPFNKTDISGNMGSAADGDQDAILGMVYLAEALDYPADFVDVVIRSIISFASADLGFPDLYRTLPGGEIIYVPKLGSMWGGLLPPHGKYNTKQQPWCYSPGYFAPAHYRTFRDFAASNWKKEFDEYLPHRLNDKPTSLNEMVLAFDSAVLAGYNILHFSSCSSGTVSNWVGVKAACEHDDTLNCPGVPWAHTPYVGEEGGTCAQSGTTFGAFGADASRTAWRIAMDYILYREESANVTIFDREGHIDTDTDFGAQRYLNRIVVQYATSAICDGGTPGFCMNSTTSPYQLAYAYDTKFNASNVTCPGVPNPPESWWAGFMAYPTFTAFVAPYDEIGAAQMSNWMDTFSSICDFSSVNLQNLAWGGQPRGKICLTSYFEASQAVISTMVMAGTLRPLSFKSSSFTVVVLKDEEHELGIQGRGISARSFEHEALSVLVGLVAVGALVAVVKRSHTSSYGEDGSLRSLVYDDHSENDV